MTTSIFCCLISRATLSGVIATRSSRAAVSVGTLIFIRNVSEARGRYGVPTSNAPNQGNADAAGTYAARRRAQIGDSPASRGRWPDARACGSVTARLHLVKPASVVRRLFLQSFLAHVPRTSTSRHPTLHAESLPVDRPRVLPRHAGGRTASASAQARAAADHRGHHAVRSHDAAVHLRRRFIDGPRGRHAVPS